eukprot:Transcript_24694.p1 GENE.Transcript_24694~~Transcript_24694.p1  ORF type:complete len:123 (-),score=5.19 Transcript_24694:298-627(-)
MRVLLASSLLLSGVDAYLLDNLRIMLAPTVTSLLNGTSTSVQERPSTLQEPLAPAAASKPASPRPEPPPPPPPTLAPSPPPLPGRGGLFRVLHKLSCWVLPEHFTGPPE